MVKRNAHMPVQLNNHLGFISIAESICCKPLFSPDSTTGNHSELMTKQFLRCGNDTLKGVKEKSIETNKTL